ncbi:MAG: metalloregulator ArsR/SmtB family transcription factor [Lactobacillus sp.]|jgi:DNA-binding transcriptional ArsR family regulator|nr:metalloregulator ArsR/SmtB family transcription factor [Lactobacillus sp.]MCI2033054.1 metalloregulator ArsR/SmtB family transcription factor [Lactobacillus sp.]
MGDQYSKAQQAALQEFQSDIGHLNALANPNRQRLLMILGTMQEPHGLMVNDLAKAIGLSQPATSHHLKALRDIGMVASRQEGNIVYYYLTLDDTIARLERLTSALKRQAEHATKW